METEPEVGQSLFYSLILSPWLATVRYEVKYSKIGNMSFLQSRYLNPKNYLSDDIAPLNGFAKLASEQFLVVLHGTNGHAWEALLTRCL